MTKATRKTSLPRPELPERPAPLSEDVMPSPGVVVKISRGFHITAAAFERHVGRSLTQWRILYLLSRCGPLTQKFLTQVTRVDAGSITRSAQSLEEEGMLTRVQHPTDNRLRIVDLTDRGRAEFDALLKKRKALMHIMMDGVSPEDLAGFDRVLARIEANLTDEMPGME